MIARTVFRMLLTLALAASAAADAIRIAIHEWTGQHVSAHIAGEIPREAGFEVDCTSGPGR